MPQKKLTPFAEALARREDDYAAAARRLRITKEHVGALAGGRVTPSLKLAGRIERHYGVKMQCWIPELHSGRHAAARP